MTRCNKCNHQEIRAKTGILIIRQGIVNPVFQCIADLQTLLTSHADHVHGGRRALIKVYYYLSMICKPSGPDLPGIVQYTRQLPDS